MDKPVRLTRVIVALAPATLALVVAPEFAPWLAPVSGSDGNARGYRRWQPAWVAAAAEEANTT